MHSANIREVGVEWERVQENSRDRYFESFCFISSSICPRHLVFVRCPLRQLFAPWSLRISKAWFTFNWRFLRFICHSMIKCVAKVVYVCPTTGKEWQLFKPTRAFLITGFHSLRKPLLLPQNRQQMRVGSTVSIMNYLSIPYRHLIIWGRI